MSQDTTDLFKVMVVTLLVFAAGAFLMFMMTYAFGTYGSGLPLIGDLPAYAPPSAVPMLVDIRFLIVIGASFLTACGIALILTSTMLDMALLVFAKAVTVLITAAFGIFAGTWAYVRLMDGSELSLAGLNRPAIALVVFFIFASVLRLSNLRQSTPLRILAAIGFILLGPIVLVSL